MRVAVIGHIEIGTAPIKLPDNKASARNHLRIHNYLRVKDEDDHLVDHIHTYGRWNEVDEQLSIWDIHLTSGLLLSSHLRRSGFDARTFNSITAENRTERLAEISRFSPELIVLSTTFVLTRSQFHSICKFLRAEFPGVFVVAGGQHVFTTLLYLNDEDSREYLRQSELDAFIVDTQGESGLIQLCEAVRDGKDLSSINNLIWRAEDGTIDASSVVPENNDVNDTLIDFEEINPGDVVHMRTARSCSFKCAFCTYPSIAGPLALMDREHALATLQRAQDKRAGAVIFTDDTFNVPADRFELLLDGMIERRLQIPWYSFLRCQYLTEDMVKKMVDSNCQGVFLGIESGSDKILKNMKKGAVSRFYRDGIEWMNRAGILTVGAFVTGFPGEDEETLAVTNDFIRNSGLDYYFNQPFYYLHHAPIHKRADEFGLKGDGLFWSHKTMNWRRAVRAINEQFLAIDECTFINPDFNLWEYAYLHSKGVSPAGFKEYRDRINRITVSQMEEFQLVAPDAVSKSMSVISAH